LVHADVKAANVMVGPGPSKLIDFGIARGPRVVTDDGTSLGSLHAMSPEQLRGDDLGPESDLFAVGVVLYQALTGTVPYPGDDPNDVAKRQAAGAPPPPSSIAMGVSDRLDQVVLQALNPERALRFNTAPAMSHALEIALADAVDLPPVVRRDETTRVVRVRRKPARLRAWRGQPGGQGSGRPGRRAAPWLALAVLAAIVVTVAFVVNAGDALPSVPGSRASASQTPSAAATPSLAPGKVRVPDTIGMSEQQAEAAARASGLRWEIRWQEAAGQTPGIYDQEPEAGSVVDRGSRFTMYAYRQPD
jgi:serine/threonine protein kinase